MSTLCITETVVFNTGADAPRTAGFDIWYDCTASMHMPKVFKRRCFEKICVPFVAEAISGDDSPAPNHATVLLNPS